VPELPEVETTLRDLRPAVTGRRIAAALAGPRRLRKPWSPDWTGRLVGRTVRGGRRRGKWIVLDLDDGSALVFHLGMSGQLTAVPAGTPRADHTHLVLGLGGTELRFRDPRRFGSATLFADAAAVDRFFDEAGLGPEPFELDPGVWGQRLKGTKRNLKAVLLDQRVVAGVGNIYADESLFAARLHPARPAPSLTAAEAGRLRKAVVAVLNRAVERRGSSIRDYVGGTGEGGAYQDEFRVYGRTGEPCPRCRTPIERVRLAGRSTHFCPRCQPRA
jgi:formamidopyrimidine-DNA glycosylase